MPRPSALMPTFKRWSTQRDASPEEAGMGELITLFAAFYDEVRFTGRARDTHEDMLLFQTGHPPGSPTWQVNVTRQLYGRPAQQLSIDHMVSVERLPWPGYVTLWSKDTSGLADWRAQALAAWAELAIPADAIVDRTLALHRF
jgi:hypothetical protein